MSNNIISNNTTKTFTNHFFKNVDLNSKFIQHNTVYFNFLDFCLFEKNIDSNNQLTDDEIQFVIDNSNLHHFFSKIFNYHYYNYSHNNKLFNKLYLQDLDIKTNYYNIVNKNLNKFIESFINTTNFSDLHNNYNYLKFIQFFNRHYLTQLNIKNNIINSNNTDNIINNNIENINMNHQQYNNILSKLLDQNMNFNYNFLIHLFTVPDQISHITDQNISKILDKIKNKHIVNDIVNTVLFSQFNNFIPTQYLNKFFEQCDFIRILYQSNSQSILKESISSHFDNRIFQENFDHKIFELNFLKLNTDLQNKFTKFVFNNKFSQPNINYNTNSLLFLKEKTFLKSIKEKNIILKHISNNNSNNKSIILNPTNNNINIIQHNSINSQEKKKFKL